MWWYLAWNPFEILRTSENCKPVGLKRPFLFSTWYETSAVHDLWFQEMLSNMNKCTYDKSKIYIRGVCNVNGRRDWEFAVVLYILNVTLVWEDYKIMLRIYNHFREYFWRKEIGTRIKQTQLFWKHQQMKDLQTSIQLKVYIKAFTYY